jgi:hypothetical protein
MKASKLTYDERQRQIKKEGYTLDHDDLHENGEIGIAALCYYQSISERDLPGGDINMGIEMPYDWPWDRSDWKPSPDNRLKELVKAGALYRAELERIQRVLDRVHNRIDAIIEHSQIDSLKK